MEADPEFLGPAGAREGDALRRRPARRGDRRAARVRTTPSTASGTARGATSATSAARRASIRAMRSPSSAPSRSSDGIDRDMGAKHAEWFVTSAKTTGWLRETELVPKTQGIISAIKQTGFALGLARRGKVPLPIRRTSRQGRRASRARSTTSSRRRTATARSGSCRASTRCHGSSTGTTGLHLATRTTKMGRSRGRTFRARSSPRETTRAWAASRRRASLPVRSRRERAARNREGRVLQRLPRFAVREGARHLDAGARADARARAGRARVGDVLRRRRHPRGGARLLPAPERAHPRVRGSDRRRDADDDLQRLHAQPAAGELAAAGRRGPARARQPRTSRRSACRRIPATST